MGAREVLTTIRNWMAGLRRAVLLNTLKSHALLAVAAFIAVTLLVLVLESLGHFGGGARTALLSVWAASAIAALGLGVVWPILKFTLFAPTDQKLAGQYAERIPGIRDRVLNALQLLDKVDNAERDGVSPELILAAGRGVAEELIPIAPAALPDRARLKQHARYALFSSVAAVALLVVFGRPLMSAAERVMNPSQDYSPSPEFVLHVAPGDVELVRGDSLQVIVTATGTLPKELTITRKEKGRTADAPLTVEGNENGQYTVTWTGLATSFEYWAYSGAVTSAKYTATIQELPAVRYLSLTLTPPAYTELQPLTLEENVGDISAVVGTQAKLVISATKTLQSAAIEFFDITGENLTTPRETLALTLEGSKATGQFTVTKSGTYQIKLRDGEGRENRDEISYRINARPDEAPVISLVEPANDLEIAADIKIPLVADAADDYGFSKMTLRYYRTSPWDQPGDVPDDSYERMALDYRLTEPGRCVVETVFDLTPLQLLPEDQVLMFVEVWDNDRISGPKRAKSDVRVLRFPSMAEIFEQQEQVEEKRTITLEELLEESQDLREEVEKAVEEYKSNPEMSYERKQEIAQLMEKQEQMSQVLEQVSQAIEKQQIANEMRSLYSPEVMEKMQQIQELVEEVITPEMREAMRKLSEAMQQPSPEEMRKALENFQKMQEQFNLALDQTLNMLKQMQAEKKLDELSRRLDELSKQQEQLNNELDQDKKNADQNAQQQDKLSQEMKKIEQEMKELAEQMKKDQLQGEQKMEELNKEMQQEQLSRQMQQNEQQMKMGQKQSAKKQGKQMQRKMQEMAQQMQDLRQQMQSNQDMETMMEMEKARDKMLDLSMRQEQLWQESQETDPNSPHMNELAEEQENLKQAMKRVQEDMQELAKKSMAVTPKLMAAMEETLNQMQKACNATQERDSRTASHYRKQALAALNETLKQQNSACKQCQSQCNKPNSNSNCNKAGGMCQKQGQINQQTSSMMTNPGTMSQGQAAAMQRLAGEQEALAKSAGELAAEASASKQTVGRLDGMKEEMEKVAADLRSGKITPETIERQNKIESKLLDFQRANREREFSPQRKSSTGIDMVRASPRELPKKPGEDQLREDLLRALDAKYTPDYEDLIRKYFDALSKWQ